MKKLSNIKKVMIVGPYPNPALKVGHGGPGVHTGNLADKISEYLQVIVVSLARRRPKRYTHININNNLTVHYLYEGKMFSVKVALYAFLHHKEYDLIHFMSYEPAYFFGLLNKLLKKPVVMTAHGYLTLESISRGKYKKGSLRFKIERHIERKAVEEEDAVIAVGKTLRKWIIEELNADPEKVFYVPNGIDPETFKPFHFNDNTKKDVKKRFSLPENSIVLLFTKHFAPKYGIEYILKSLKILVKKYKDIYLVATNEDNNYLPKIKNLAKDLKVYDECIFTGRLPRDELIKVYNIADIFLHTSINEQETFGISLIEAMACELPVIATAVGGPKEILEEGKKQMGKDIGILIPPKDPEAIAQSIIYLLEHPEEARKMGKRAREFVLKNYTWDRVAKKTMDVYKYAIESYSLK